MEYAMDGPPKAQKGKDSILREIREIREEIKKLREKLDGKTVQE